MTAPVIIGAGIAGLMTALHLAPAPCVLLTRAPLGEDGSSLWAQGGIAAAVGADDGVALHVADTIAAGDGLCDPAVVERSCGTGRTRSRRSRGSACRSTGTHDGALLLGLEAAHARRRIVHAGRDGTGREIMRALVRAVRERRASRSGAGGGAAADAAGRAHRGRARRLGSAGEAVLLPTRRVVLATGGIGGLFEHTTNPAGSIGHGLMLAAEAGAVLADPEFVQFHPTALDSGTRPLPLVSEAVRGEGAILIDETGERFMRGQGRAELEPRDVVARAVWRHGRAGHRVFLDARHCLGVRVRAALSRHRRALPRGRYRSRDAADPGAGGGALPHGRRRGGRGGAEHRDGPLGLRRGRGDRPARRQPPRQQLAA